MSNSDLRLEHALERLESLLARYETSKTDQIDSKGSIAISEPRTERSLAQQAGMIYRSRRLRDEMFGGMNLFGEPAYDILLDLYVAESEGKLVSITSASIASAVSPTTGLRWLSVLGNAGLVTRIDDISDGRRSFVRLTSKGLELMQAYLHATRVVSPPKRKQNDLHLIEGYSAGKK